MGNGKKEDKMDSSRVEEKNQEVRSDGVAGSFS
jgi:hypothetical protein